MRSDVSRRAAELRAARVPYVSARVVLAERPTSARPGDEALVLGDGTIEGFVGGSCAESTVRSQALALLDSGETALLRITPRAPKAEPAAAGQADRAGRVVVHNPCLSGGSLEIFLEPVVPAPLVLVAGSTPIAAALVAFGDPLGYEVRPLAGADPLETGLAGASAVLVASHGRDEEPVLDAALRAGVPYVGLVASPKRGAAVVASLSAGDAGRIRTPAGLDLGARTPGEIAVSILAEVVASRPRPAGRTVRATDGPPPPSTALDPVCGMSVATREASLHLDVPDPAGGTRRFWFCGSGCLRAFAADPDGYRSGRSEQPA